MFYSELVQGRARARRTYVDIEADSGAKGSQFAHPYFLDSAVFNGRDSGSAHAERGGQIRLGPTSGSSGLADDCAHRFHMHDI